MEAVAGIPSVSRVRRALAVMVASVVTISGAAVLYLHPDISLVRTAAPLQRSDYTLTAIDFVSSSTGWVVASFGSGDFALLHTDNGGLSWTRQLSGHDQDHVPYLHFFDPAVGLFALTGMAPRLQRTADGGKTWTDMAVPKAGGTAISWSFVDSRYGWVVINEPTADNPLAASLFRTEDGARSWTELGSPTRAPDYVFQANFSFLTTGWLTGISAGPYAYHSGDFGATWSKVELPAPPGGWPRRGNFFVAVRPTADSGAIASVVHVAQVFGRSNGTGVIRAYPPLVVRGYDGGRLETYVYTTVIDLVEGRPFMHEPAPNEVRLRTLDNGKTWHVIEPPAPTGAIGFFDAIHWWWIGSGQWAQSADGGVTWSTPRRLGAVDPVPGSLRMLDGKHAWFAGAGSRPVLESTSDGGVRWQTLTMPAL